MKDCYYDLRLHFILLDDSPQSYILKLRDRGCPCRLGNGSVIGGAAGSMLRIDPGDWTFLRHDDAAGAASSIKRPERATDISPGQSAE